MQQEKINLDILPLSLKKAKIRTLYGDGSLAQEAIDFLNEILLKDNIKITKREIKRKYLIKLFNTCGIPKEYRLVLSYEKETMN